MLCRVVSTVVVLLSSDDQVVVQAGGGQAEASGSAYLTAMGNWDGQWYAGIAQEGYPRELPRNGTVVMQNPWAFYPMLPALSRIVMELTRLPFAVAASAVSLSAGAGAAVLLHRMLAERADRFTAGITVLALCMSPAAAVLQAAYTESLALLLVLACLRALGHRRYGWLAALAVALSLTRAVALPLAAVVAVHWLVRWFARRREPFSTRDRWRCAGAGLVSVLSFGLWPAVTAVVTGVPQGYFRSQQAWFPHGSAAASSWLGHLGDPGGRAAGGFALAALVLLATMVLRPSSRPWGVELRAWVLLYPLYMFVATRPLAGIVRYALLAVVPFWPVARPVGAAPLPRAVRVLAVGLVIVVGAVGQVLWVRHVFVATPSSTFFP